MNILVLQTHALHLGYLGCYGNEWVGTPNLDGLAAEAVIFDHHYADGPHIPQENQDPSWWTGRYHFPHSQNSSLRKEKTQTLPQILEAHGIAHAVIDCRHLGLEKSWQRAFAPAFKQFREKNHWLLWADLPVLSPPWHVPADLLQAYFEEDAESPNPWVDPPVGPLEDPEGDAWERLQNTYAAVATCFDAQVGHLLDNLREQSLWDDLMICLTASSGLALGEHGVVGPYRAWMHEEVWHVPLIVRLPGGAEAGRRIAALTQPLDLVPTFLDALGLPLSEMHGHSLLPLMRGEQDQVRAYACGGLQIGDSLEWALRTPAWAFLLPMQTPAGDPQRRPQLYVKPDDRWEVNDVRQHYLELAEQFEQTLRGFVETSRHPGPFRPPELRDKIEVAPNQGEEP